MNAVSLRKIPFPFQAMMAICSDLDETPDKVAYLETMKFLNTTNITSMGAGVGLEVGNTIYFDMPPDQFSYWNTDENGRDMIRTLIRSGHIDCLHSFGDLANKRMYAARALEELARHNCKLEVWIDHGIAPSNFGRDIMKGKGDITDSEVYHADLTCGYGIKYVWRGRVTSIIGQDSKKKYQGIWNDKYPSTSAKTISKEFIKGCLASIGNSKYSMHGPNHVIQKTKLRSGQEVVEFIRANPHWGGVSCGETADGLAEVLNDSFLNSICHSNGFCVLYTHLGKFKKGGPPFSDNTIMALNLLASYSGAGKIMVTTTKRLLRYCHTLSEIKVSVTSEDDKTKIDISYLGADIDLSGLTLYVPGEGKIDFSVNGHEFADIVCNPADYTGQKSVSIPWKILEFPGL